VSIQQISYSLTKSVFTIRTCLPAETNREEALIMLRMALKGIDCVLHNTTHVFPV